MYLYSLMHILKKIIKYGMVSIVYDNVHVYYYSTEGVKLHSLCNQVVCIQGTMASMGLVYFYYSNYINVYTMICNFSD